MLSHDPEFTATGAETKINYQADYDFYLERLFKHTPWARSIMDYFSKEVFDITSKSLPTTSNDVPSIIQARTWEDDLLDALDSPASIPASSAVVDVISHASISVNNAQSASATAQVQMGISQLTLGSGPVIEPSASATRSVAPEPEAVGRVTRHGGSKAVVSKPRGRGRGKR